MTLPTTGPLTLAQIRAEFGAPAGTPLHAFYRGGPWVPNVTANNGVPTAPPITAHQLHGATKQPPFVVSGSTSVYWAAYANTGVQYTASGYSYTGGDGSPTFSWIQLSGSTGIRCGAPSTINGSFNATAGTVAKDITAVFRLTASDAGTTHVYDVSFEFEVIGTQ